MAPEDKTLQPTNSIIQDWLNKMKNQIGSTQTILPTDPASKWITFAPDETIGYGGEFLPNPAFAETDDSKKPSLGDLTKAYEMGIIADVGAYQEWLRDLGYDEQSVELITALAEQSKGDATKGPELGLGSLLSAYEAGTLDNDGLLARLSEAGFTAEDQNLIISTAQAEQERKIFGGDMWAALDAKVWNDSQVLTRLVEEGYSQKEAQDLLATHKAGQGGKDGKKPIDPSRVYDPNDPSDQPNTFLQNNNTTETDLLKEQEQATPNTITPTLRSPLQPQTRPDARRTMQDFQTSFVQNLKSQAGGLSVPARTWAMQNMDMFLDDYLGMPEGTAFTKGAAEIEALYQGQKGVRQASSRAGQGTGQARMI